MTRRQRSQRHTSSLQRGTPSPAARLAVLSRVAARNRRLLEAEREQRRQAEALLAEKGLLLQEIHHRVKNNLQVISSLLDLQSRQIQDPVTLDMFLESQRRVRSMAIIHETLSRVSDVTRVNAGDYMPELVQSLSISYGVAGRVSLGVDVADVWLGLDVAFPCGLIVNELVSNALKHAFPGGRAGQVRVVMAAEAPSRIALTVADDGVGLPPDLDWHSTRSLGLRLVQRLVRQIRGEMTVSGSPGTTFTVIF